MDPCGKQKKIKSDSEHVSFAKLLEGGGGDGNYGGGFNKKSGTRTTYKARDYDKYKGTVKGATKHTYGVNGENDND